MLKLEAETNKKIVRLEQDNQPLGFICGHIDNVESVYGGYFVVISDSLMIACIKADVVIIDGELVNDQKTININ